jgi:NaMN:DMB phosphoribosyltransferase
VETELPPEALEAVQSVQETCQPSRVSVICGGGDGGSARAGMIRYPLKLTRAVHENKAVLAVGGAPLFLLPGGGITFRLFGFPASFQRGCL